MTEPTSFPYSGLKADEVEKIRLESGWNELDKSGQSPIWTAVKALFQEPMFLLLLAASILYFISGQTGEGLFMVAAIVLVSTISLYQDARSRHALEALNKLTEPLTQVIRDGIHQSIPSRELVPGDIIIVEEGNLIPADGQILKANDFTVNESILTGESFGVTKSAESTEGNNEVFQGTLVTGGLAFAVVTATGRRTKMGQIGKQLVSIKEEPTPLQAQVASFVKKMALTGIVIFLLVWLIHYMQTRAVLDSLLKALTLAMSILPEEIPVAFTTFMALGAWRLLQKGIIVKQTTTVEALGSASVICTDKTGTITENRMSLAGLYSWKNHRFQELAGNLDEEGKELIRMAMFASEPVPFDPMEKAIHEAYSANFRVDERPLYQMEKEYPLDGKPPMMTHVFLSERGDRIIAAKGAPEALLNVSNISLQEQEEFKAVLQSYGEKGYRVLAVGMADGTLKEFPAVQQELHFQLVGFLAFYDPPKPGIKEVFKSFYEAGIKVKILTGDNALTTRSIANEVDFRGTEAVIEGSSLIGLSDEEVQQKVNQYQIFARLFPEAKLRIIEALKGNQEVVAMTGDGVNDGPALKAAHIGIAMGNKGSELAQKAASLVITDDDLGKMVEAVAMGRKIYTNLKKAIRYIISIHIPIILIVFLPLALGWIYPDIFTPVHVIFLELIMGPTCSIIYENEPMEPGTMQVPPRPFSSTFFSLRELSVSILQGLVITAFCLGIYQFASRGGVDENGTRTMVFLTLVTANVFLTLVNRSFQYTIFTTIQYRNRLMPLIISVTILMTVLLVVVAPIRDFFGFRHLESGQYLICLLAGMISVVWYEPVKYWRRMMKNRAGKS